MQPHFASLYYTVDFVKFFKKKLVYYILICQAVVGILAWNDFVYILNWHIYITYISAFTACIAVYKIREKIVLFIFAAFVLFFWVDISNIFSVLYSFVTYVELLKIYNFIMGYVTYVVEWLILCILC